MCCRGEGERKCNCKILINVSNGCGGAQGQAPWLTSNQTSYLGGGDHKDCDLRPAQVKSSQDLISTNGCAQWYTSGIPAMGGKHK
jgi:hypothetical protein